MHLNNFNQYTAYTSIYKRNIGGGLISLIVQVILGFINMESKKVLLT